MGNDGGSIPKRRELVKNAARAPTVSELKATALESLGHAWSHCALSGGPLEKDVVVSDWRGRLYNYESILKGLMPSEEPEEVTPASLGIRSIRDVQKLKFSTVDGKWMCPLSMKELGPAVKAVYLVPCGHAFAEAALKEVEAKSCPECAEELTESNVIPIIPTTEKELEKMQARMDDLRARGLTHTLKKDKSEKKKKRKGDESREEDSEKTTKESHAGPTINNPLAASLTARVMAEQEERNKRRKLAADAAPRRTDPIRG